MARRTQEQRKAETRARLIDAAAELFATKGFHAVSAEAVADAADRTTGALYSHFGGKEGLLLALLDVWKERTAAQLSDEVASAPDPGTHFAAMWGSITRPAADRGDSWLLLEVELWLHGARDAQVGSPLARRYAEVRQQLGEGLDQWAEVTGTRLPRTPYETGGLVLGVLLGCALQHRLDPGAVPEQLVVDGLSSLLGLRTPCDVHDPSAPVPPRPTKGKRS
ncbi:TetR/AcrR family transcriptional regulator [Streptomyces monticola]|uniref:TetR/AcrR family transcriptional regulator n=1 Tax=Streptomyces monticola TaxID=2666263 RepID=A0ABW2JVJ8_9ACTN